ncbi:effector-binding domain-containing protein [Propionicimonas paludicola]|uniref:Effector-binding domain-containing protein n=1 Tax=Propionicimonas paludicola TaxID=185243 RepID=A0A2A9CSR9_9ACTN|nr:effector-binding domain-containing protein [Propionicimonas paludicola]
MAGVDPHFEELDAWVSAGVRQVVPIAELAGLFTPVYDQVSAAITQAGAVMVGPAYAEYFAMPEDTVDVEIGFGIAEPTAIDGLNVRQRPATTAVVGTHFGGYDSLDESYAELMPWLESQDVALGDSMFEWYLSEPDEAPENTVTKLVFPLA